MVPEAKQASVKPDMALKAVLGLSVVALMFLPARPAAAEQMQSVPLAVPAGVPLRLYLTKRVAKKLNAPVEATLLTPVFAFDHEVIPAGTRALGHISRVESVPRWTRVRAILNGDFTPLHIAQIRFTSLLLPDGRSIDIDTKDSFGLNTRVPLKPPKQRRQSASTDSGQNGGLIASATHKAKDAVNAQVDRIRSIPDVVTGPGKKEWLYDYAMSRLPYHPQYFANRTRFDAELLAPLDFGPENLNPESVTELGSPPAPGSIAHARLLTAIDSKAAQRGERVQAVLEQPLFSADHKLVLPEGTLVNGSVLTAKKARWFHRGGRLRFNFQAVELTPQTQELMSAPPAAPPAASENPKPEKKLEIRTEGALSAAEGANSPVKVDKEGGVQASESKKRFIGAAAALFVARRAADNDPIRNSSGAITGQSQNIGGRTLGGGMGFGLLGSIAAQSSRNVGAAFGYYGLAWAVFSTVVARGAEAQFDKNAVIEISFGEQPRPASTALAPASAASSK